MNRIYSFLFLAILSVSAFAQNAAPFSVAASTGLVKATDCPLDQKYDDLILNTWGVDFSMYICPGVNATVLYNQSFDFQDSEDVLNFKSGGIGLDFRGTETFGWAVGPIVGLTAEYGTLQRFNDGYDFQGFNSGLKVGVGAQVASMLQLELTAKTLLPVFDGEFQTSEDVFFNSISLGVRYSFSCGANCEKACCKNKAGKACCKKKGMEMAIEEKTEEEMEADMEEEMARMEADMMEMEADMEEVEAELNEQVLREMEASMVPANVELFFEKADAKLSPAQKDKLDELVSFLKENSDFQVGVSGYADTKGSTNFNSELSGRRAESVRQYLLSQGIEDMRIFKRAFGETFSQEGPDYRKVIIEILN